MQNLSEKNPSPRPLDFQAGREASAEFARSGSIVAKECSGGQEKSR
jgi:hypothetical protein